MGALNQNYATAITRFQSDKGDPQCFQAAGAGAFNQRDAETLSLAAYVLFWIDGAIQYPGASFLTRQFIWGNLDDDNSAGWGIYLEPDGSGQMLLTAGLYAASGLRTSEALLSNGEGGSFVERLICAALWYDGGNLSLTINGSLQPVDEHAPEAYAASALPATLGGDVAGDFPATHVRVVSAGYAPVSFLPSTVGDRAGAHFRACRESDLGGYLDQTAGVDWAHRYEASAAMIAATSGAVTKTALGPTQASAAVAPTALADQGNLGPTAFAGTSPVALNRLGVLNLYLDQVAQPDWYDAPAFEFAAVVP